MNLYTVYNYDYDKGCIAFNDILSLLNLVHKTLRIILVGSNA